MFSVTVGLSMCYWTCSFSKESLKPRLLYTESYIWFGCGYFIHDIFGMFRTWNSKLLDQLKVTEINWNSNDDDLYSMIPSFKKGELNIFRSYSLKNQEIPSFLQYLSKEPVMIFHHLMCSLYGIIVVPLFRQYLGDCVISHLYLMEISTPFVNLRAILSILGYKNSKIYALNGILMLATFFIFRVALLLFMVYLYSKFKEDTIIHTFINLPPSCQITLTIMFCLQLYWFSLMARQAVRFYKDNTPSIEHQKETNHAFSEIGMCLSIIIDDSN